MFNVYICADYANYFDVCPSYLAVKFIILEHFK